MFSEQAEGLEGANAPQADARHLPFHISELGRDFAVAHREHIHTTNVPGLSITHLAIYPEHDHAVSTHDYVLGVKVRIGILLEPRPPECDYGCLPLHAAAIRRGRCILENCVVCEHEGQGVRVMPIECIVESIDYGSG